jgi:DNA-binding FrmR family transcriptional regulator
MGLGSSRALERSRLLPDSPIFAPLEEVAVPGGGCWAMTASFREWVETYTVQGYMRSMRKDVKAACAKRLNRIEGQVRGISRMVEEDRYCIDIVTQISAVRAALRRLEEEVLHDHVTHCVEHAIASGNKAEQRRKVEELMSVVKRANR